MDKTSLGDRMKEYESVTKFKLTKRTPVIIRVDGKAFHTWTKRLSAAVDSNLSSSPYSSLMHSAMQQGAIFAAEQMQNFKLAYIQSDEISFFLKDWETLETQQWFNGNVQKIASVTASAVTAGFTMYIGAQAMELLVNNRPMFDARVFQLPKEEVANYFIWRQQDATRNSINMLGQYHFSHKSLQGKNVSQVQDMLMNEKGVNWNNRKVWERRGSCVERKHYWSYEPNAEGEFTKRSHIVTVNDIPIFTKDRKYIEDLVV